MRVSCRAFVCVCFLAAAAGQEGIQPVGGASKSKGAELPELVSERPDFTDSAEVVGRAILQVETGFGWIRSKADGEAARSIAGPYPLLRLGLTKRVELRLSGEGYYWRRVTTNELSGLQINGMPSYAVGVKVKLFDQSKRLPDFAVIGSVTIPQGHPRFRAAGYDPDVKLCAAKDAPLGFVLSGNVNFASIAGEEGRHAARAISLSVGHAAWRRLSMFSEIYRVSAGSGQGSNTFFDSGVTHPLGGDAQIDVFAGHSLAGREVGWFAGVGLTVRRNLLPGLRR